MEHEPQNSRRYWDTAKGVGIVAVFVACAGILGGVGIEVTKDPDNTNVIGALITDTMALGFAAGAAREWRQLWRD